MSSRSLRRRIQDIVEVGSEIETFTQDLSFAEFVADIRTVRAVLYSLAVMGEAAASLLPEVEVLYPEIPWIDIRGIRNVVIHEYFRVDLEIVWETIQTDLPQLFQQLRELLEGLERT
ncbi:HepT-like ribonuclease domain-containing protein [Leptolyngbya sp. AN03gr2]|uniref:HepT-like ribonuclease domain-containing protein n=1 Tax=unclassified Leptolyngbya TaxID=2650499 RepID=UPI003D31867C